MHTTMKSAATPLTALSLVVAVQGRTLTVSNGCSFTIWPAMFTDLVNTLDMNISPEPSLLTPHCCQNAGSAVPSYTTG